MKNAKYSKGDMVVYKIDKRSKQTYTGVIIGSWHAYNNLVIYDVAAMHDSMSSYSIGENYIEKKIS